MGVPSTHHGAGCSMIRGAPRAGERPVAWPWGVPWGHQQGTPQMPVAPRAVPCRATRPALLAPPDAAPPASSRPLEKSLPCFDGPLRKSQIPQFLRVGKPPKKHNPPSSQQSFPFSPGSPRGVPSPGPPAARGVPSPSARRPAASWAK